MVRSWRLGAAVPTVVLALLLPVPATAAGPDQEPTADAANVAHRGASRVAPENTMAAVRRAVAADADFVGIDVRRTRNDKLVVLHDRNLARTTDVERVYPDERPWRVRDFSLRQIRRLDAGSWWSREYRGVRVPSLADVLRRLEPGPTGALLEVKSPRAGTGRLVHRAVRRYTSWLRPGRRDRLVVQSYDEGFVRSYHRRHRAVPCSVLGRFTVGDMGELGWADQVNMPYRAALRRPRVVRAAHRNGLGVVVHTVNRGPRMHRVLDTGVDAVSTDRPKRLHRVLGDRREKRGRAD